MVKNLNRRGYILIEIILASVIAFAVIYYLSSLTIKLKARNDDILAETLAMTDVAIIENKLYEQMKTLNTSFDCEDVTINGKIIKYGTDVLDILNDYVSVEPDDFSCTTSSGHYQLTMKLKVSSLNKVYDIKLDYIPTAS